MDSKNQQGLFPIQLRCEGQVDPLAIVADRPRLEWKLTAGRRAQVQTAYQVGVASDRLMLADGRFDVWDSGKVVSGETIHIEYSGPRPAPAQRFWWKVRVWDGDHRLSDWSEPAAIGGGLEPDDWTAGWVGFDRARDMDLPPAPFDGANWIWLSGEQRAARVAVFAGTLELPSDVLVVHAEMALSVAGNYRFYWGPEQFGMSDGEPHQWRRPYIRDLVERVHPGVNRFIVKAEQVGDEPVAVLFKIVVRSADGRSFTMCSDDNAWRATDVIAHDWHVAGGCDRWPRCGIVAPYGAEPWGVVRGVKNFLPPPAYLRNTFQVNKPVRDATLFVTALGWYDVHLNGQRVNETFFDPGWTDYNKRLYYRAYDVTTALRRGENAIGAILADGWFSGYVGWCHQRDLYGKNPRFRAQLHVRYVDGTTEVFSTGPAWRASLGPITEADILMGEAFDARRSLGDWTVPSYEAADWQRVDTDVTIRPILQPHPAPPVVALERERFVAEAVTEPTPGAYVFDLGQNFAGVARLTVRNAKAGQVIRLRFAERLNADGTLYTINLRTARATDYYTCRGDAEETWMPRFTFHGFQFVEVTGLDRAPDADTVVGVPLSSDTPVVGSFNCSDRLANQLASNAYWSQRSNFLDVPMDCPQRDERLGWSADAQNFVGAAVMRADVQHFFNKWATDMDDAQWPNGQYPWLAPLVVTVLEVSGPMWDSCSPAWMDAGIVCPWAMYEYYGDRHQLAQHYPNMVRQVEWYVQTSTSDLLPPVNHRCLSDWLNHDAPVPDDVFRQAFFAHSVTLLAKAAAVIGRTADARKYAELAGRVRAAFVDKFVDQQTGEIEGDAQGCYALALHFDLLDERLALLAADRLIEKLRERNWAASTGMQSTLPLMLTLAKLGRNDIAYRILHNEAFPSWNFSINNGATTLWERWDSWTPERGFGDANMNSFNHFSFGAVYQWMVENIGGIRNGGDAFKRIIIAPTPGGRLTRAAVSYDSIRGPIRTAWSQHGQTLNVTIEIPPNTTATVTLPTSPGATIIERTLGDVAHVDAFTDVQRTTQRASFVVGSGSYHFEIHPAQPSRTEPALVAAR